MAKTDNDTMKSVTRTAALTTTLMHMANMAEALPAFAAEIHNTPARDALIRLQTAIIEAEHAVFHPDTFVRTDDRYEEGHAKGYRTGYDVAYKEAYDLGFENGFNDAQAADEDLPYDGPLQGGDDD